MSSEIWQWPKVIADLRLRSVDWRLPIELVGNRQSQIGNPKTHPLPRGGTDLMFDGAFLTVGRTAQSMLSYRLLIL